MVIFMTLFLKVGSVTEILGSFLEKNNEFEKQHLRVVVNLDDSKCGSLCLDLLPFW